MRFAYAPLLPDKRGSIIPNTRRRIERETGKPHEPDYFVSRTCRGSTDERYEIGERERVNWIGQSAPNGAIGKVRQATQRCVLGK